MGILFSTLGFILGSAVSLEAAKPQLTKEAKSQKNQMQKNLERENRISVLKKYLSWKQFKQFWKKLNQLSLNKNSSIPVLSADPDLIKLFERLRPVYKKWKEIPEKYLSLTERKVLQTLTEARVKYFTGGFTYLYVMHRAPMPHETHELKALSELERKISLLQKLRQKNAISAEEWNKALDVVYSEIQKYIVLKEFFSSHDECINFEEKPELMKPFEVLQKIRKKYENILKHGDVLKEEKESAEKYLKMAAETESALKTLRSVLEELER